MGYVSPVLFTLSPHHPLYPVLEPTTVSPQGQELGEVWNRIDLASKLGFPTY